MSSQKPQCDCLSYCGDDPRIERGSVQPCEGYIKQRKEEKEQDEMFKSFGVTSAAGLIKVLLAMGIRGDK